MNNSKYNFERTMSWIKLPLVLGMVTMMMFLAPKTAMAQFIACQDQVNITLGTDCSYEISPGLLLKNQDAPDADYSISILDADGNPVGNTITQKGDYTYHVTYLPTGNHCSGAILAEDKLAPAITCPDEDLPTVTTLAGALESTDPTADIGDPCWAFDGGNPTAGAHFYDTFEFTVSETGNYTFTLNSDIDAIAAIVSGAFDPANVCANIIAGDDDAPGDGGGDPIIEFTLNMSAGCYTLVTSSWDTNITGAYDWSFTSATGGEIQVGCPALDLTCLDIEDYFTPDETTLEDGDILVTGNPSVIENCGMYTVTYSDVLSGGTCGHTITRTFTAVDMSGNSSTCTQDINFRPLRITDLTTPSNIEVECEGANGTSTDPEDLVGGYPQVNGVDVVNDVCNIGFTYSDIVVDNCGGTYKIIRTMTLLDWCTNTTEDFVQLIQVVDTTAPEVSCSANISVSAAPYECNATVVIPQISYADLCNGVDETIDDNGFPRNTQTGNNFPNGNTNNDRVWYFNGEAIDLQGVTLSVEVNGAPYVLYSQYNQPYNANIGDAISLEGIGDHTIVYSVTDVCGNTSTCETVVTVTDDSAPIAVCDQFTTATLDEQGVVTICAETFDDGSYDNCDDIIIKVKRMDALAIVDFDNCVDFYCADQGDPIMVRMRVYEASSNPSFEEEELFGLLYNECMVEVTVEDKTNPVIICPQDKYLDCDADYPVNEVSDNPLDGTPVYYNDELIGYYAGAIDNCEDNTIVVEDQGTINDCGEGTIYRTWTVTASSGASASCVQKITLEKTEDRTFMDGNLTLLSNNCLRATDGNQGDVDQICWPKDKDLSCDQYDLSDATGNLDVTGEPELIGYEDDCANLFVGYEDKILNDDDDSCVKILRTWKVIDWCQYNEASNYYYGIWELTQTIKIEDNEAPVLTIPADVTVESFESDCHAWADFELATATDNCDSDVTITNDYYQSAANGPDASADFPAGETTITFTAEDNCGNVTTASFTVTVVDGKKPTPVCLVSLGTVIMPSSGSVEIWASELDASSYDDCGDIELRVNHILPGTGPLTSPPDEDVVTFFCPYIGEQLVQLWVIDEAGNYDYCITSVIVQDPNDACGDVGGAMAMIAGSIETENQDEVEDVNISVSGTNSTSYFTGDSGLFEFLNLPMNGSFDVTPEKDMNYLNGVTTFDLVLISQHILGVQTLDSPYKIIAADANKSNTVTTLDLVKLQRLILNIDADLAPNTSWRFVDTDHTFADATNPFASSFPELISLSNLATDEMAADFIGVKIGDVNGSAIPNSLLGSVTRSADGTLTLSADDAKVAAGETFTVDFKANDFANIYGYQYTLTFDSDLAAFAEVVPGALKMDDSNFGFSRLAEGVITTSWFDAKSVSIENDAVLFSLSFTANGAAQVSEILDLNSQSTRAEAYGADASILDVNLTFNTLNGEVEGGAFELFQNQPNPFKGETTISFNLPTASNATITVMDISGRVLKSFNGDFAKGYNEIKVNRNELEGTGVLYYQVDTPSNSASMKMILID